MNSDIFFMALTRDVREIVVYASKDASLSKNSYSTTDIYVF